MVVCTGGMPSLSSVNRWNSEVKAAALIAHRLVAHMLSIFPRSTATVHTANGDVTRSQVGVAHIVRPEHQMGKRVAHLVRGRMLDYIEFDDGYAIVKTTPPKEILGRTLAEAGVRQRWGVTIVGIKSEGKDFSYATPTSVVNDGDLIIVSGDRRKVERFSDQE